MWLVLAYEAVWASMEDVWVGMALRISGTVSGLSYVVELI
jgi:hypothetical protein